MSSRPCTGRASCRTSRSSPSTRSTSRRRTCGPSTWTPRPCAPPRSTTSWATSTRGPSSSHAQYLPHMSPCNRSWKPYLRCRATKMVVPLMGHIVYGILAPATALRLHRLAPVMPLTYPPLRFSDASHVASFLLPIVLREQDLEGARDELGKGHLEQQLFGGAYRANRTRCKGGAVPRRHAGERRTAGARASRAAPGPRRRSRLLGASESMF